MEAGSEMKNLLMILAKHFDWLFTEHGFRITYSDYSDTFGGEGLIRLENDILRIDLINDRDRVFLNFLPREGWKESDSVSYDLIRQILTKEICDDAKFQPSQAEFLRTNFAEIISLFAVRDKKDLLRKFDTLKKQRAQRLFGGSRSYRSKQR